MDRREFVAIAAAAGVAVAAPPAPQPRGRTGFVYSDVYLAHQIYRGHPESPERLRAITRAMAGAGLDKRVIPLAPLPDPMPFVRRIHSERHVAAIDRLSPTGRVAAAAAGGALAAVKAVSEGVVRNAFCAIRPPGHHAASTGREEGFCFYNNVAVAARYAQEAHGRRRVLIIDWDYHHGNGTEEAFYEDPTVLFFSTHNARAYPGTGWPNRRGKGAGEGYTINVHLDCGATEYDMFRAWDEKLAPALERFAPDIVLISCGFDCRHDDPLGCFSVSDPGFSNLTRRAMKIADTHCDGRLVSVLEGGYNIDGLGSAACAHVAALLEG